MAFTYFDRVKETSVTTGTGNISLGGAVAQFIAFQSVYNNGDNMYYCIADQSGTNWEVGIGTYNSSGNTLSRTAILASSNSGSVVNFTSGALYVWNTFAASNYLSSTVLLGSAVGLSTGSPANVTSISLPPGDWEVSANIGFTAGALTTATVFIGGISQTSATLPTAPTGLAQLGLSLSAGGVDPIFPVGCVRILNATSGNITVYLVAQSTFATSTMAAYGFLQAWKR